MALVDAATFKTQNAAIAAALTIMWQDDTLTEMAHEIRNPHHPLRRNNKMLVLDPATSIVTSDDTYIDAAYAGSFPNKGNGLDKVADSLLALVTATVEAAEPADIVLTFDKNISSVADITIGGTANTIVSITIAGAVVTVVVGTPYAALEPITLSGVFRSIDGGRAILIDEVVTNNVV